MSDLSNLNALLESTSHIVAAYITHHKTTLEDLPHTIRKIFNIVSEINCNAHISSNLASKEPAVAIKDSVHEDYIICLEDGKKLHMLKRHIRTMYGMTLEQYKERWNLPHDYPTVCASYAKRRSTIARSTGLGKTGRKKPKLRVA